jgi:hypothetical protein
LGAGTTLGRRGAVDVVAPFRSVGAIAPLGSIEAVRAAPLIALRSVPTASRGLGAGTRVPVDATVLAAVTALLPLLVALGPAVAGSIRLAGRTLVATAVAGASRSGVGGRRGTEALGAALLASGGGLAATLLVVAAGAVLGGPALLGAGRGLVRAGTDGHGPVPLLFVLAHGTTSTSFRGGDSAGWAPDGNRARPADGLHRAVRADVEA